ncbi:bromodomain containing protein [Nitzschia inconspicua]|uniref:histone acetyltransferase n=1 Tax=Nitzschia inconspicua TaxID=303405 RepID=A0A9K3L5B5_9STRA|nr:bromodomain containing protein [Nitzschia inconspicua]
MEQEKSVDTDEGNSPKDTTTTTSSTLKRDASAIYQPKTTTNSNGKENDNDNNDDSDQPQKKRKISSDEDRTENEKSNVKGKNDDEGIVNTKPPFGDDKNEGEGGTDKSAQKDESNAASNNVSGSGVGKELTLATTKETTAATQEKLKQNVPNGNPYDSLKYMMVTNDGKPESLIKLVALKSLFSKQLPKMPRAYIARLVFDRRHVSLAILNENPATKDTDEEVIGSICYRPFYDMKFAEIAFCAVNASHQVKGYGTKLMNLVKREGARTGIEYFITYADNYAIGYFKKQGFSKSIAMPKGRYQGLIKDYDGGTMMECYVHPSIDYTRIPEMLAAQREFILSRIRLKAQSTKVYPPLPKDWNPKLEGASRGNEAAARALAIPGMLEAGWTMADLLSATGQGKDLDRAKNALKSELLSIVRKVEEQQYSWPFREPVDTTEVKDYLDVIKEPIDLSTIDKRIRKGDHYRSKKMLYADLMLMVNNCKLYNEEGSTYTQCARNLETYLKGLFANL